MKKLLMIIVACLIYTTSYSISPYYNLGSISKDIESSVSKIKSSLSEMGYEVIGEYKPGNNKNLYVIAYTNKSLKLIAASFKNRGYLASVMKIGVVQKDGQVSVSMTNPEYIFNAYFGSSLENATIESSVNKISAKIIADIKTIGTEFKPFGGDLTKDELREYHYMFGMPYFSEPIVLKTFNSFADGVKTIKNNLAAKKGNTIEVYEIVDNEKKVAVFGIGLMSAEIGESHFLPIIGEENVAAMPYEIILQDKEATMLHGRFRFALYWPKLTMGTFTKIMSTPGDVEDTFELLVK